MPEQIAAVSATHREYTNIQGNFAERKSDLYAKAKPEALKGVIAEIQNTTWMRRNIREQSR